MIRATFIRDVNETRGQYGKQRLHCGKLYKLSEPVLAPFGVPTHYVILARSIPPVKPTNVTVYPSNEKGHILSFSALRRFETDSFEEAAQRAGWAIQGELA